mgnify:CR=1 FL=1
MNRIIYKEGSDKPPTITRLLFVKRSRTAFACRRLFHGSCRDLFCVIHFDAPFLCGILKEILCGNGKFLSVNCQCVILKEIIEIEHIAIVIGNLNDLVIVIEEFVTDYCCILNRCIVKCTVGFDKVLYENSVLDRIVLSESGVCCILFKLGSIVVSNGIIGACAAFDGFEESVAVVTCEVDRFAGVFL